MNQTSAIVHHAKSSWICLVGALAICGAVRADPQPAALAEKASESTPLKLTVSSYQFSGSGPATDINLRHSSEYGNAWFGYFQSGSLDLHQWRLGWDRSFGESVRVSPSLQLASQGFAGGSLQFETGSQWFVGAGIGRTNLKPYWNLNFDPNDSYSLSAGYRSDKGQTLALLYVRDNRLSPDQRHLHAYWRQPMADAERLTLDLLYKEGLVDGSMIHRWGASVTYDWPKFLLRVAYDPKANFGQDNLWRFSVGTRF